MHKKLTISLDEAVYAGLKRAIEPRKISQFIEDLIRPLVAIQSLDAGYREMAADTTREKEAQEWCEALIETVA